MKPQENKPKPEEFGSSAYACRNKILCKYRLKALPSFYPTILSSGLTTEIFKSTYMYIITLTP